jgi:hypothetical protein
MATLRPLACWLPHASRFGGIKASPLVAAAAAAAAAAVSRRISSYLAV